MERQGVIQIAQNNIGEMTFGGSVFVNGVSLKYIGMIYTNVVEMVLHSDERTP